jgi:hypothetical protein
MPPFIVRPKETSEDPNDYSGYNSTPWHPELTVFNFVIDPLKTKMIFIKGHEYHSAQSSYQPHDLTYQSFCKTHVSHGNNALSSIAETNSRGLDAFTRAAGRVVGDDAGRWRRLGFRGGGGDAGAGEKRGGGGKGERKGRGIRPFGYFLIDCNGYMSPCIYSPGRLGP